MRICQPSDFVLLLAFLFVTLCPDLASSNDAVTFESQIRPLLKTRCFSCHGESDTLEGALDVRRVREMLHGGDSGSAVVPGNRDESLLYQRLREGEMPPGELPRLTSEQIELVGKWIDAGAKTERPEAEQQAASFITAADREFWSFQALKSIPVPNVSDAPQASSPIDAFILEQLDRQHLTPAERADPRMLVRRLYFVLTGLPPTFAQVETFARDPSSQRYEELVDELLASPRFGERWGRSWLDLVRYVDITPSYLTSSQNAWRYRDWVIDSFNHDRPYDEFLRLQLAADLLPETEPQDLAALGLLGLSPVYWKELKLAPEVIRMTVADEWDERVDMVSRTFLGLSVACARCHNHKFDPISVEDYYALAGVMANTQLVEKPMLPPTEMEATYLARKQVNTWEEELKGVPADAPESRRDLLRAKIAAKIESTPDFHAASLNIVEDARVEVVPDGSDATKILVHRGVAGDLPVFRRGNPEDHGEIVSRRFLSVLSDGTPVAFESGSGRSDLAEAMLNEGRALAARVMVNRIWAQVFGQGLVRTVSDFGVQGDRPTHPELLEYLAFDFVEGGWSMKRMIRQMVLSEAFQRSSHLTPEMAEKDPDGRLLSHMTRRKMDVEGWRDSLLQATGQLDLTTGGPAGNLDDPGFLRRTVYAKVVREDLNVMLRLFDFPEALSHSPCREQTTTPMQQLFVLNGPLLDSLAKNYVHKLMQGDHPQSPEERIRSCYCDLFQRVPTDFELQQSLAFLGADRGQELSANEWETYLHVLLSLNEMAFVD